MVKVPDITITSLETITCFDIASGAYRFAIDELQDATIANTQEKVDITGKGGRKLSSIKRNKAVTVSGTNGMLSGGLLEAQTGGTFVNKIAPVMVPDYITVNSNKATTTYKAVGTAGAEIDTVYVRNTNSTLGQAFTQAATAGDGKFAYDPATKEITFASGALADGTEIVAYYTRNVQADVLENPSDTYSEKLAMYIDAFGEDKCNNVYRVQFYIPKADFNGEFDFTMGEDQLVHAFEAESLVTTGCGAGSNGSLWTYTVFGTNAEDATAEEGSY